MKFGNSSQNVRHVRLAKMMHRVHASVMDTNADITVLVVRRATRAVKFAINEDVH
jgi:hypothetical protein